MRDASEGILNYEEQIYQQVVEERSWQRAGADKGAGKTHVSECSESGVEGDARW